MASKLEWNRRSFIKGAAVLGAAPLFAGGSMAQQDRNQSPSQSRNRNRFPPGTVPKKPLGRTGVQVSAMGLGGYHLGSAETDQAANEIVAKALDHGVDFFDNAWEYHDGLSEERLGKALKGKRDRAFVMTKVCTHGRDKKDRHAHARRIPAPPSNRSSRPLANPRSGLRQRSRSDLRYRTAQPKPFSPPSNKAKFASSDLPDTKILRSI